MAINFNLRSTSQGCQPNSCPSQDGCPDICPDFIIRRHDTKPAFKISVEDCDGPLNVQGLVVEINMWAKGKLKSAITTTDTYFALADGIGFYQIMIGDIIVMDRVRAPEYMLVTAFDEDNKFIQVERGYRSTTISNWKKGTPLRIFRIMNAPGETEIVIEDISSPDGTIEKNVLTEAYLQYEWRPEDTCLPGCYWLEFKILKMKELVLFLPGGNWTGSTYQDDADTFFTGEGITDSTVSLSYDSVNDLYLIPTSPWTGEFHLYSGEYYTGSTHDEGSVYLNKNDIPSDSTVEYNSNISVTESEMMFSMLTASVTPSFTPDQTYDPPTYFGCLLGEGIEWERRFPLQAEGFLIKITESPSAEI